MTTKKNVTKSNCAYTSTSAWECTKKAVVSQVESELQPRLDSPLTFTRLTKNRFYANSFYFRNFSLIVSKTISKADGFVLCDGNSLMFPC